MFDSWSKLVTTISSPGLEVVLHGAGEELAQDRRRGAENDFLRTARVEEPGDLRARLEKPLGCALGVLVARAGLHAGRQKIIGDSLRDVAQNQRTARIVEIGESVCKGRKL